jgi:hypothetical protein
MAAKATWCSVQPSDKCNAAINRTAQRCRTERSVVMLLRLVMQTATTER